MRSLDWSESPLGSAEKWPAALKTLVSVMLGSSQPMLIVWGPELTTLYNDGYAAMCGARHPRALGRPFSELWFDIWDQVEPILARAYAGQSTNMDDIQFTMHRNGYPEETHFAFSYTPVALEDGEIGGMFCACTETTATVLAERRRASEIERQQRLFEDAPGFIAILSGPDHVFEFTNGSYRRLIGGRNPVGLPARAALPEVEGQGFFELLDEVYRSGEPFVAHHVSVHLQRSAEAPTEERFLDFIYAPTRDETGAVTGIFCEGHDVTESQRAQEALRDSEAELRLIADALPVLISYIDSNQCYRFVNRAYEGWFGVTREQITGKPIAEVVGEAAYAELRPYMEAALAGKRQTFERLLPYSTASARHVHVDYVPAMGADGEVSGVYALVSDIGEAKQAEAELRESEARLRALTDHLPGGMVYQIGTGKDGSERRFTYVSKSHEQLTGIPAEAVLADPTIPYELIHPDDRQRLVDAEIEALKSGSTFDVEARFRRADGETRWCRIISAPREQNDGSLVWDGIQIDITEQKEAEASLRESEEQLRLATEAAEVGLWDLDMATDTLFWPPRVKAMFGISPDVPVTMADFYEGLHPDDADATSAAFATAVDPQKRAVYDVEYRTIGKQDGLLRWVAAKGRGLFDPKGNCLRVLGTAIDVTARKQAEAALRASEEKYRSLFSSIDAGFCIVEMEYDEAERPIDYRFVEVNPAFEQQTGLHDAAGKSIRELAPAHEQHWFDLYGEVARTGEPARFERPAAALDERWYDVYAYRTGRPEERRVAILFNDVSQRRWAEIALRESEKRLRELNETLEQRVAERTAELEQAHEQLRQSQKLEAMGQLTGGVAHDFNNLLTPIIGSLDLLHRRGLGGAREQRLIDGALQSAERAKTLVQRLLAFARRQPLQASAVDVAGLVQGMADLIASTSGPKVEVVVDVDGHCPPAKADPNQLEMAILNLSVNARDAMPEGGRLTISAAADTVGANDRRGLREGRYVRLTVADTGAGMDEATLAKAIEPFFSTKGVGKGTGLGLSMVHGLASQLGGALFLSSKVGLGTCASLWLPVSDAPAAVDQEDSGGAVGIKAVGRALVVDDEELVRMSTADMLSELGYAVTEASSAEEALQLLDDGTEVDVLVTDHLMVGMTGADLARQVREKWPGTPVLIVSGYAETDGVAPDVARLTKPFRQSDLAASLAELAGEPTDG